MDEYDEEPDYELMQEIADLEGKDEFADGERARAPYEDEGKRPRTACTAPAPLRTLPRGCMGHMH